MFEVRWNCSTASWDVSDKSADALVVRWRHDLYWRWLHRDWTTATQCYPDYRTVHWTFCRGSKTHQLVWYASLSRVITSRRPCKSYTDCPYVIAFSTNCVHWCTQSIMDCLQPISVSMQHCSCMHRHYVEDYAPPAPQTTLYLDYLQSSANELFHSLDRQRGILCHMNSELYLLWTVSSAGWKHLFNTAFSR